MTLFAIWSDGRFAPCRVGESTGDTFADACRRYFGDARRRSIAPDYDAGANTYAGMRLYPVRPDVLTG